MARQNISIVRGWGRGGTLLDLGANIGEVVMAHRDRFDRIVAVEAHPDTFAYLSRRVRDAGVGDTRITLINAAVRARGGATMYVTSPSPLSTSCQVHETPWRNRRAKDGGAYYREVVTVALNELIAAYRPRCVKMDIEDSEYECLADGVRLDGVDHMCVEFHHYTDPEMQARTLEIVSRLAATGLRVTNPENLAKTKFGLMTLVFAR